MTEAAVPIDVATLATQARLRSMSAQLQGSWVFIALNDAFMAWLVARNGPSWIGPAVLWWCCIFAIAMVRRRIVVRSQNLEGAPVHRAMQRMNWLWAAVGVVRAAIVLLAFATGNDQTELLLTLMVVGLAAGATATSGGSHRSVMYWGVPVFAVLAGCWVSRGNWADVIIAMLMLALFRTLLGYAKALAMQQEQMLQTSEALRIERDRVQSVNQSISQLVDQLRDERDRAAAANESKTRFLASASHDLRQPLYALELNATALDDIARGIEHPQLTRVSQGIRRSLAQSRHLLNSLLDMSKLEANAVEVQWQVFDLRRFVANLLPEYEAQARENGLAFAWPPAVDAPLWVRSDPAHLERLLGNLLHNAIKFTPRGQVGVRLLRRGADLCVEVFDCGPGIPLAERTRVFEEFYQLDNPSRDRSRGLGLGLSIVRLLALLLEARVEIADEPGGGCCFKVWLALAATPAMAGRGDPLLSSSRATGAKGQVLVIDDEPEILDAVSSMLAARGWDVVTAHSSSQALQRISAGASPQVLLVDYRLNGENGLQAIAALRAGLGTRLPAVIVTGDTAPQRILETADAGCPVLHKPVDGDAVELAIGEALQTIAPR